MVQNLKFIILIHLYFTYLNCCCHSQSTQRDTGILIRKRRYLGFPKGSNLVYTVVYVKALMQKVPPGVIFFNEFDVPHPLPPDTSIFRGFKHHVLRRQLLDDIATGLDGYGLNGTACVNRIVCEARQFIPFKGKSLVKDMLSEIFLGQDTLNVENNSYEDLCDDRLMEECPHPLLDLMWGSFTNY